MDFIRLLFEDVHLENFDNHLQDFYHRVVEKELNLFDSINACRVKKALREVVCAYKKHTVELSASRIRFDSPEKRCAYILKHCPCFSSAVARHIHELLTDNRYVLYDAICRRQVNVCCLGGGPATDAVAVVKVINAFNNCIMIPQYQKLAVNITIVDLDGSWKSTADKVLQTLQETPEFCDFEKVIVNFQFLEADLTKQWKDPVEEILSNADIVTMVYFVSAVNGSRLKAKCPSMIQNVMNGLKTGALLFFLDSAKELHFECLNTAADSVRNIDLIYGPHREEFHKLSKKSIKRFVELYPGDFSVQMCLTNCFISTAGWVKNLRSCSWVKHPLVDEYYLQFLNYHNVMMGQNSRRKKMNFKTKMQENFRKKIMEMYGKSKKPSETFTTDDLDFEETDFCETEDWVLFDKRILFPTKRKQKRIPVKLFAVH